MNDNILEELNAPQREAVVYCDGPQLVIAGAGSGKTRVLTYKIAYLLSLGLEPWGILALTFTNKAAREMKERIAKLVGEERAKYLNMGTFHSIFSRILRAEASYIGFTADFTIYDQSDSRSLIKNIIKEMQLDDKKYKPAAVADRISMAKNHLISAHSYGSNSSTLRADMEHGLSEINKIYINYAERCRQANAMDFDDLLLNTYRLFADNEEVRKKYAERFKYILVDEYQDTNKAQQAIVMQLAKERLKVCAVGDDAQSIYSFRGANIDNILDFQTTFAGTKLFKLERNYRSTQNIVKAASSLIKHNQRQIPKEVFSENEGGERVRLKQAYSDKEEAAIVCRDIEYYKRSDHCEYSDFAILYRTNSQSRSFEEELRRNGIPYRIYGGLSFYQRKEIKDIIAYMRLAVNPSDEEAFRRIINYPTRGIGDTTLSKIITAANDHGVSLWATICNPEVNGLSVSKGTISKLKAFMDLASSWMERVGTEDAFTLGKDIIVQSGISKDIYSGREPDDIARQENVEEFLAGLQEFVEGRREQDMGDHVLLTDFLQEVSLLSDLDSDNDDNVAKVNLMTVHSAKGLEFPTVFVVGLEENIFPSQMCSTLREIEEERRLLYVAITRAEKHCILTYAENRWRYGRMEFDSPSRFIRDIDPRLLDTGKGESSRTFESSGHSRVRTFELSNFRPIEHSSNRAIEQSNPRSFAPSSSSAAPTPSASAGGLQPGMTIEHQRFGIGSVLEVTGSGENAKATVQFRNTGTKQLLLKFAKYKIIGVFILAIMLLFLSPQNITAQNNRFGIDDRLNKIFEEADKKRAEPEALELGKRMYDEAVKLGDKKAQAIASTIPVNYYGYKKDETNLKKSVAESKRISKECGFMDYYYFSWCRLISYYLISSKSYKGMEEAIALKKEAMGTKEKNHYGVYNSIRIMGDFYWSRGDFDKAYEYYKEGMDYCLKYAPKQDASIFYTNISRYHRERKEYQKALNFIEKGITKAHIKRSRIRLLAEKACILFEMKRYSEFKQYADMAKNMSNDYSDWDIDAYKYLSIYECLYDKDYANAHKWIDKLEKEHERYMQHARLYAMEGRWKEAYEYRTKQCESYRNRVVDIQTRDLAEFNAMFNNEQLKADKMKLELEKRKTKNILEQDAVKLRLTILILVMLAMSVMLIMAYVYRKKSKKLIHSLRESNEDLIVARKIAEDSDRMKTIFVQNVSHEIRTPLNAIVGFSNLILDPSFEMSDEERNEFRNIINNNTDILTALVNDVLVLSELQSGKAKPNFGTCKVNEICRNAITTVEHRKPENVDLKFTTNVKDDFTLTSDSRRLSQVIINFLTNAEKYTTSGFITLDASLNDNKLTLSVTDTGCGIPLDKQSQIFGRFEKLDDFHQGMGLGLNICSLIANMLNAEIGVDGTYTDGARFYLTLPICCAQLPSQP